MTSTRRWALGFLHILRMRYEAVSEFKKQTRATVFDNRRTGVSNGRRTFLGAMAASWAGLTGSALVPTNLLGPSSATLPSVTPLVAPCAHQAHCLGHGDGRSDKPPGKSVESRATSIRLQGVPYGASTSGAGRFMRSDRSHRGRVRHPCWDHRKGHLRYRYR